MSPERRIQVRTFADIVAARQHGRSLAESVGFSNGDQTVIATAISELARNIVAYAQSGEIALSVERRRGRDCVIVVARDHGPGISDLEAAMRDGFSTSHGMGMGLPGTRRLMDEFEILSEPGNGTTVTARKWRW